MRRLISRLTLPALLIAGGTFYIVDATAQDNGQANSLASRAATLLSVRCIKCHGPDKKSAGVDLSTQSLAIASKALVPGDAGKSLLVLETEQGKMPPDGKLSSTELHLLKDWVAAGATYSRERLTVVKPPNKTPWSLLPIQHPTVPSSKFDSIAANPVDRFLFTRLQRAGLAPSPPASRHELLRRVSIDLIGLPPTLAELKAFEADRSPNAYEKVVDRLLASRGYGERWGRAWLDVVRYGESHGYEQNHLRPNAWPYRDYVIRSLNQDKPYDQFLTEQIAGDIVGRGNPDVEVATGFLVAGIHDTVGIQTEDGTRQQRANDLDDIVSTTAITFLGLSLNCARCHDHKFDPIPTRDYYRMTAIFSGVYHGDRQLTPKPVDKEVKTRIDAIQSQLVGLEGSRKQILAAGLAKLTAANHGLREPVNSYSNEEHFGPVTAKYVRFTITAASNGSEPCLDEIEIYGPTSGGPNLALASGGAKATASSVLPGYVYHQIAHLNDGKHGNSFSWISNERGAGWAQIELPAASPIGRILWSRDSEKKLTDRVPTSYRIEVSMDGGTWTKVASDIDRSRDPKSFSQERIREQLTVEQRGQLETITRKIDTVSASLSVLAPITSAYCGRFDSPTPIYILPRGDVMHRGDEVTPGTLSQIPGFPGELKADIATAPVVGSIRLASAISERLAGVNGAPIDEKDATNPRLLLARWMCDSRNPLTSRVIVNRIWERHFGHGLVDTPSDFGNMGMSPSHPELLDWLASDLTSHGWRLKRLHKLLVTSYAYRQTSAVTATGLAHDGDNRLIWHMPLRRMEAEAVRDSILAVSGKLDLNSAGGPGYMLFKYSVLNVAIYETREDQGPDTWRRSVYQIPARGIRDSLLGAFDCPDSSDRAAHRTSTTTALQALSMLNGMFLNQQSGFFADRVRSMAPSSAKSQVNQAFLLALGRMPKPSEAASAEDLVKTDGLETLCRGLFNANEFIYY